MRMQQQLFLLPPHFLQSLPANSQCSHPSLLHTCVIAVEGSAPHQHGSVHALPAGAATPAPATATGRCSGSRRRLRLRVLRHILPLLLLLLLWGHVLVLPVLLRRHVLALLLLLVGLLLL